MASPPQQLEGAIYLYNNINRDRPRTRFSCLEFIRRKFGRHEEQMEEHRRALVKKTGNYRIKYSGLAGYKRQFLSDLYITLVDLQWRYAIAIFFNIYLISFMAFAFLWWLMAYNNGDFNNLDNPDWTPCIGGVTSFPGAILFSIETQTTIGYGFAYPNVACGGSLPLIFLQITIGLFLENFLLGYVFVKFAQPKRRRKTLKFSKHATVSREDGNLCLQVRVGDIRQTHLLDAKVHGVLVKRHVTEEGVLYPLYLHDLKFEANGMGEKILLMWPMVLSHKITPDSPFWEIKPSDFNIDKYEVIVYIEGTIESTGEFCQARTSYTPSEIFWGQRFDRIEEFDAGNGRWDIDFAGFNDLVYCGNIRHSAKDLAALEEKSAMYNNFKIPFHIQPPAYSSGLPDSEEGGNRDSYVSAASEAEGAEGFQSCVAGLTKEIFRHADDVIGDKEKENN